MRPVATTVALVLTMMASTAFADGHRADDDLLKRYLNEVYHSATSQNQGHIDYDEWQQVAHQAADIYYDNIQDGYTNDQLTHYLDDSSRFREWEDSYGPYDGRRRDFWRQKYRHRHHHVRSCHICNKFTRLFLTRTSINPPPFHPGRAYYQGRSLRTRADQVFYGSQWCPISLDHHSRRWEFDYRGRRYPLSF